MPTPERLSEIRSLLMRETIRADAAGTALEFSTLQPLYAERNTSGVDLSQKVGRLCHIEHLCNDIAAGRFTLANIGPAVWGDDLENVLRDATFFDPVTGGDIEIRSLMDGYYGSCWTYQPETQGAWDTFGIEPTKVRIESTVGQLLAALMHPGDPGFSVHLYAGLVQYRTPAELEAWPGTIKMNDLTDTEGRNISMALSVVRDDFCDESEVRIIYNHHGQEPWEKANVSLAAHPGNPKGYASIPCNWRSGLLNALTLRSDIPAAARALLTNTLAGAGLTVPIGVSAIV